MSPLRRNRTRWLISALGVAVLLLGALIGWRLWNTRTYEPESTPERVRRQLTEYDPTLRLFDMTAGHTPGVVCGYAGEPVVAAAEGQPRRAPDVVRFVARPNRILTSRDPLSREFSAQVQRECPRYFTPPPARRS